MISSGAVPSPDWAVEHDVWATNRVTIEDLDGDMEGFGVFWSKNEAYFVDPAVITRTPKEMSVRIRVRLDFVDVFEKTLLGGHDTVSQAVF